MNIKLENRPHRFTSDRLDSKTVGKLDQTEGLMLENRGSGHVMHEITPTLVVKQDIRRLR